MYTIFKPLDPDERLTREQVLAARRFRSLGRWEAAGAMWLPLLVGVLLLDGWGDVPAPVGLTAIVLTFVALLMFALKGDRILARWK